MDTGTPYLATNFKIQSGSGAIDTGDTISGFSDDYWGTTRPQDSAWDIGAYEVLGDVWRAFKRFERFLKFKDWIK